MKYTGELGRRGRPGLEPEKGTFAAPATAERQRESRLKNMTALLQHELRGLDLLCGHYGIAEPDPTVRSILLSLALARDHVPYFQERQAKRGPKQEWARMPLLEVDIRMCRLDGSARSDWAALEYLTHHKAPWNARDADAASLARRRREHARDPLVMFVRRAAESAKGPKGRALLAAMRRNLPQR